MSTVYSPPSVDLVILDYERPNELETLFLSLRQNAHFSHRIIYLGNGGDHSYVKQWEDFFDVVILNKDNVGCGIATRQAFQSCMAKYVIYVQVDQWLARTIFQEEMDYAISQLKSHFYVDLAGNQGNGKFSERAFLIERNVYLGMPGLNEIIGGPGPFAQHKWTEQFTQEHMARYYLTFASANPLWFRDNGKVSVRTYGEEYGGKTMHYTDEKTLFVLEPFKKRADGFPNLNLNDEEWAEILEGRWPKEGKIPAADKVHSFVYWKK